MLKVPRLPSSLHAPCCVEHHWWVSLRLSHAKGAKAAFESPCTMLCRASLVGLSQTEPAKGAKAAFESPCTMLCRASLVGLSQTEPC